MPTLGTLTASLLGRGDESARQREVHHQERGRPTRGARGRSARAGAEAQARSQGRVGAAGATGRGV